MYIFIYTLNLFSLVVMEGVNLEVLDLKGLQALCLEHGLKSYGSKRMVRERLAKYAKISKPGPVVENEENYGEDWSKADLMAACDEKGVSHRK